jgi:hypothetical protein
MKSYYDINTAIRYHGPSSESVRTENGRVSFTVGPPFTGTPRWKQPPHDYLAGLNVSEKESVHAVLYFTRRFGPMADRRIGDQVWIDIPRFLSLQELLQDAWHGAQDALEEIMVGLIAELELEVRPQGLELQLRDLWTLIRLLFLRDYARGKAKVCANPDCSTPCFVQARRGQKYCSHNCAVLINVRRFRAGLNKKARERQRIVRSAANIRPAKHELRPKVTERLFISSTNAATREREGRTNGKQL